MAKTWWVFTIKKDGRVSEIRKKDEDCLLHSKHLLIVVERPDFGGFPSKLVRKISRLQLYLV